MLSVLTKVHNTGNNYSASECSPLKTTLSTAGVRNSRLLQKLQENSHKLKFHVAFLCHVAFCRIKFLWVFVTCWVAVLAVLQKCLVGLSKNALGRWQQGHQRVTTTQHALRLSSSVKTVLML